MATKYEETVRLLRDKAHELGIASEVFEQLTTSTEPRERFARLRAAAQEYYAKAQVASSWQYLDKIPIGNPQDNTWKKNVNKLCGQVLHVLTEWKGPGGINGGGLGIPIPVGTSPPDRENLDASESTFAHAMRAQGKFRRELERAQNLGLAISDSILKTDLNWSWRSEFDGKGGSQRRSEGEAKAYIEMLGDGIDDLQALQRAPTEPDAPVKTRAAEKKSQPAAFKPKFPRTARQRPGMPAVKRRAISYICGLRLWHEALSTASDPDTPNWPDDEQLAVMNMVQLEELKDDLEASIRHQHAEQAQKGTYSKSDLEKAHAEVPAATQAELEELRKRPAAPDPASVDTAFLSQVPPNIMGDYFQDKKARDKHGLLREIDLTEEYVPKKDFNEVQDQLAMKLADPGNIPENRMRAYITEPGVADKLGIVDQVKKAVDEAKQAAEKTAREGYVTVAERDQARQAAGKKASLRSGGTVGAIALVLLLFVAGILRVGLPGSNADDQSPAANNQTQTQKGGLSPKYDFTSLADTSKIEAAAKFD